MFSIGLPTRARRSPLSTTPPTLPEGGRAAAARGRLHDVLTDRLHPAAEIPFPVAPARRTAHDHAKDLPHPRLPFLPARGDPAGAEGAHRAVDFHVMDVTEPRPEWFLEMTGGTTAMPVMDLGGGAGAEGEPRHSPVRGGGVR